MSDASDGSDLTPAELVRAVKIFSRCLESASLQTLREAHASIRDHFMGVLEATRGTFENASEQRVLGMLWAEIEMAIDERERS